MKSENIFEAFLLKPSRDPAPTKLKKKEESDPRSPFAHPPPLQDFSLGQKKGEEEGCKCETFGGQRKLSCVGRAEWKKNLRHSLFCSFLSCLSKLSAVRLRTEHTPDTACQCIYKNDTKLDLGIPSMRSFLFLPPAGSTGACMPVRPSSK